MVRLHPLPARPALVTPRLHGVSRWVPLAAAFTVSLVMLFSPGSTVPSGPPNSDKVAHLLLFAALASAARLGGVGWRVATAWILTYAVLSEILQAALPIHRSGSLTDFAADGIGVGLGLALFAAAGSLPRRRMR